MLKKQMIQYTEKLLADQKEIQKSDQLQLEIYKEEKDYIEKHHLLAEDVKANVSFMEKESHSRFTDVYIERCDKESEELLAEEMSAFLDQSIHYFKNNINEFMYLESKWFDIIGVDAISFEADSVFGTYDVMLGLKVPKKAEASLKTFLTSELHKEDGTFDLMFSPNDGLWDFNFSLNDLNEYNEKWTIQEAYSAIYRFLFRLVEAVEEMK
ncbi:branched-chain amino acid aminotransferase [Bacillus sp. V3B]|uniref:branched-chain amino acid aminotransferase n=1 Tax=Bacillus sp. V3B TaxID=2804915 RepID=UPI00210C47E8|nr:branched-chain amino acid aminotransferase [Bacillus sp. V3B]MCQ6276149.1 branched-chain amino acid aminotransferase [Bacillus sp. V3B]